MHNNSNLIKTQKGYPECPWCQSNERVEKEEIPKNNDDIKSGVFSLAKISDAFFCRKCEKSFGAIY